MSEGIRVGVTGMPRAGTSLMMRICKELGCTLYGQKSVPHFSQKFNEDGYWELHDYEVPMARHDWNKDEKNRVIKVFPMLIRQFEVDRYIVMERKLEDAIKSFQKVLKDAGTMEWCGVRKFFIGSYEEAEHGVNINHSTAMQYIHRNEKEYITVKLEMLKQEPKKTIEWIAKYLDIESTADDIARAVKLVRR